MIGDCWVVDRWSRKPEPIRIIAETEKTITIERIDWRGMAQKTKGMKRCHNIFATWEDAKAWMIKDAEDRLFSAKQEVDRRRSDLELKKALKQDATK